MPFDPSAYFEKKGESLIGIKGMFVLLLIVGIILFIFWPQLEGLYYRLLIHFGFLEDPLEEKENNNEKF